MITGYDAKHLQAWLDSVVHESDRETVLNEILAFEADYPEIHLEDGKTWPIVRELAHRYTENKWGS